MDNNEDTLPHNKLIEGELRPKTLNDFIGQKDLINRLRIAVKAANDRDEAIDHILLCSPPGLGKTSMAHILAHECGSSSRIITATSIKSLADLIEVLVSLDRKSVLFLDECHNLSKNVQEHLFSAMTDRKIEIKTKCENKIEIVDIELNDFCLIGATTDAGRLTQPFRDRFGIIHQMDYYDVEDLMHIVELNMAKIGLNTVTKDCQRIIAERSRGTPRIAIRLLRRIRDYACVENDNIVTMEIVNQALLLEGIDSAGLDRLDRKYMHTMWSIYGGGPAGLNAMASTMGEDKLTIQSTVEPYLTRMGLIARAKRGRQFTSKGWNYVNKNFIKNKSENVAQKP